MMTDGAIETLLLQLRNCRENDATYRSLAQKIEGQLDNEGITYKLRTDGSTAWKRAADQEGADPCGS